MSEKERQSGEQERDPQLPVLPIVNAETEKAQAPKAPLHPAVYIA